MTVYFLRIRPPVFPAPLGLPVPFGRPDPLVLPEGLPLTLVFLPRVEGRGAGAFLAAPRRPTSVGSRVLARRGVFFFVPVTRGFVGLLRPTSLAALS